MLTIGALTGLHHTEVVNRCAGHNCPKGGGQRGRTIEARCGVPDGVVGRCSGSENPGLVIADRAPAGYRMGPERRDRRYSLGRLMMVNRGGNGLPWTQISDGAV